MKRNRILVFCTIFVCFSAISSPVFCASPDKYEPDNTIDAAKKILLNPMVPEFLLPLGYEWEQIHNFYAQDDEDWVKFYVCKDQYYRVDVSSCGKNCDPVIEIYDNTKQLILTIDDYSEGHSEYAEFLAKSDGIYYAKIRQCDTKDKFCHASYGEGTEYHLTLIMSNIIFDGFVVAIVESYTEVTLTITDGIITIPLEKLDEGVYAAPVRGNRSYTLTTTAKGFATDIQPITVKELETTTVTITLKPCIQVSSDLALNFCAEYLGKKYGCTLNSYDLSELTWEMDVSTFGELQNNPGNCLKVGDDLTLNLHASYQGKNYGFVMNYDADLIWKMDIGTFKEE